MIKNNVIKLNFHIHFLFSFNLVLNSPPNFNLRRYLPFSQQQKPNFSPQTTEKLYCPDEDRENAQPQLFEVPPASQEPISQDEATAASSSETPDSKTSGEPDATTASPPRPHQESVSSFIRRKNRERRIRNATIAVSTISEIPHPQQQQHPQFGVPVPTQFLSPWTTTRLCSKF